MLNSAFIYLACNKHCPTQSIPTISIRQAQTCHLTFCIRSASLVPRYRIGIPIFVPSLSLLVEWELAHHVMSERVYWKHTPSPLRSPSTPDPNSLDDQAAVKHWLQLSDYFVYPHIQYFDSAKDLAAKLASVDMKAISALMRQHSAGAADLPPICG